ncbi:unnamed protein product (macronuclear) [Paramecium tetraurelia]|uniref:Uncharacterized protein n=1 Tax=Paramecium tetraurelia TaxID=5888 RepID=A0CSS1_PARTE|nr:uncharacterized protein GSPATT00010110001 [Paramecium tetraurelia]CAK73838.1 unnamed protein product [Paramecium tetraurelia]|eukprot:XP_001441235.1 hypothetical protein (macronuclear) [Paramecium tetraurelia strain d4-2]
MRGLLLKFRFTEQISTSQTLQIKRFYKDVKIEMAFGEADPYRQWLVKLDGKTVKTPSKNELSIPTPQLAQRIADEFSAQAEFINPATMPLMTLARNAVDIEADENMREFMEHSIISYLERDTVLFREQSHSELYQIQMQKLDPQLKLFNQKFGMHLKANFGLDVEPLKQYDQIRIETILKELNSWQLVCLDSKVENLKSCILAFQIWNNQIDVQEAVKLSRIEEDYQISLNGKIEGHHDFDEETILANVKAAKLFSQLIQIQSITY